MQSACAGEWLHPPARTAGSKLPARSSLSRPRALCPAVPEGPSGQGLLRDGSLGFRGEMGECLLLPGSLELGSAPGGPHGAGSSGEAGPLGLTPGPSSLQNQSPKRCGVAESSRRPGLLCQPREGVPSRARVGSARHPWSSARSRDGPKTGLGVSVGEEIESADPPSLPGLEAGGWMRT